MKIIPFTNSNQISILPELQANCDTFNPLCTCNIRREPGARYLVGKFDGFIPQLLSKILGLMSAHLGPMLLIHRFRFDMIYVLETKIETTNYARFWENSILCPMVCSFNSMFDSMVSAGMIASTSESWSDPASSPESGQQNPFNNKPNASCETQFLKTHFGTSF